MGTITMFLASIPQEWSLSLLSYPTGSCLGRVFLDGPVGKDHDGMDPRSPQQLAGM